LKAGYTQLLLQQSIGTRQSAPVIPHMPGGPQLKSLHSPLQQSSANAQLAPSARQPHCPPAHTPLQHSPAMKQDMPSGEHPVPVLDAASVVATVDDTVLLALESLVLVALPVEVEDAVPLACVAPGPAAAVVVEPGAPPAPPPPVGPKRSSASAEQPLEASRRSSASDAVRARSMCES
jgi:hypothetical protein